MDDNRTGMRSLEKSISSATADSVRTCTIKRFGSSFVFSMDASAANGVSGLAFRAPYQWGVMPHRQGAICSQV